MIFLILLVHDRLDLSDVKKKRKRKTIERNYREKEKKNDGKIKRCKEKNRKTNTMERNQKKKDDKRNESEA